MKEVVKFSRPQGFFERFDRRPGPVKTNMHYCPGCGHGILHKLIAEAVADLGLKDRAVLVCPVGCSVFAYYYFDFHSIECAHGRAPAVATAITRADPENVVIGYQGDGDLASIGFNQILQAANRGENMCVFFVNNAIYGMAGGQMAPTSLPGQKTQTSPCGRNVAETGYPIRVAEMISQFQAPVYVERCAMSSVKNIMATRRAVRKAIQNQVDKKGFSFVEVLSGCPINLKMKAKQMNDFISNEMTKFFPLGVYKDEAADREPIQRATPIFEPEKVKELLYPEEVERAVDDTYIPQAPVFDEERRVKISGFGGQGVLSLGYILATMGKLRNFNVSWLPSYGPEMRGGTANCSIVFSKNHVGSPQADHNCNLMICLNQPSMDKFLGELSDEGVLLYDTSTIKQPTVKPGQTVYGLAASDLANTLGDQRVANSVILGAISVMMEECFLEGEEKADMDRVAYEAIQEHFAKKPAVAELNWKAYQLGKTSITVKFGARVK